MPRNLTGNPPSADPRASQPVEAAVVLRGASRTLHDLILDRYDLDGVELGRMLFPARGDLPPDAAPPATLSRASSGDAHLGGRLAPAPPLDSGTVGRPFCGSAPADAPGETRGYGAHSPWRDARPGEKSRRSDERGPSRAAPPRRARRAREEWNERGF